ncbi:hypothetical protein [Brumimicrobium mesophilum]|uniref:hypothetical protein n=1 Tax=Brumimicrobium mesophilum TaxID=392717 RepID=UPI000D14408C|nr:hypothetical protein [Brumimicrobium mesophilum]
MKITFNNLKNEKVIGGSDNGVMVLTNQRIHSNNGSFFGGEYMTMNLENISSMEVRHSSNSLFLYLGIIGIILTLFFYTNNTQQPIIVGLFIFSVVFLGLYFSSRSRVISIYSNGASKMIIQANNMNSAAISDVLNKIAEAKSERINELKQFPSIHI